MRGREADLMSALAFDACSGCAWSCAPLLRACAPARLRACARALVQTRGTHDCSQRLLLGKMMSKLGGRCAPVEEASNDMLEPLAIRPVRFGAWVRPHFISARDSLRNTFEQQGVLACKLVRRGMYINIYLHTHTQTHTPSHTHTHTCVCVCVCVYS